MGPLPAADASAEVTCSLRIIDAHQAVYSDRAGCGSDVDTTCWSVVWNSTMHPALPRGQQDLMNNTSSFVHRAQVRRRERSAFGTKRLYSANEKTLTHHAEKDQVREFCLPPGYYGIGITTSDFGCEWIAEVFALGCIRCFHSRWLYVAYSK